MAEPGRSAADDQAGQPSTDGEDYQPSTGGEPGRLLADGDGRRRPAGSETRRLLAVVAIWLRAQARNRLLMGFLVVLPAYVVVAVNATAPAREVPVWVVSEGLVVALPVPAAHLYTVLTVPLAGALVAGIAGMLLVQRAGRADRRLVQAGLGADRLLLSRFAVLGALVLAVTAVSLAATLFYVTPARPGAFALMVVLTAAIYGLVGMVVGALLDSLPGTYVMLFGPVLDVRVFQNPLVVHGDPAPWMTLLPGHFPVSFLFEAAFSGSLAYGDLGWSLVYLAVVGLLAAAALSRKLG